MKFAEVYKEQEAYKEITAGVSAHAFIIEAKDEFSSRELSHLIALYFVCNNDENSADYKKAMAGCHPDIIEYPKKARFVVEESQELLENAYLKPMLALKKVFIINSFDKATLEAMNKILKVLEEPPKDVKFILNTSSLEAVLPTIVSRCVKLSMQPLKKDKLIEILGDESIFKNAIDFSEGYLGKALELKQKKDFDEICLNVFKIISDMKSSSQVLFFVKTFAGDKNVSLKLDILERFFEDILLVKNNNEDKIVMKEFLNKYNSVKDSYSNKAINEIFKKINVAKKELLANVNQNIVSDNLLLNILEVKFLCK